MKDAGPKRFKKVQKIPIGIISQSNGSNILWKLTHVFMAALLSIMHFIVRIQHHFVSKLSNCNFPKSSNPSPLTPLTSLQRTQPSLIRLYRFNTSTPPRLFSNFYQCFSPTKDHLFVQHNLSFFRSWGFSII